jgi:hypothetical protein
MQMKEVPTSACPACMWPNYYKLMWAELRHPDIQNDSIMKMKNQSDNGRAYKNDHHGLNQLLNRHPCLMNISIYIYTYITTGLSSLQCTCINLQHQRWKGTWIYSYNLVVVPEVVNGPRAWGTQPLMDDQANGYEDHAAYLRASPRA